MATPANAQPKPGAKKGLAGLPWWAWAGAAVVGLAIGFLLTRSGSAGASRTSAGNGSSPQKVTGAGGGGPPLDILDALGLRSNSNTSSAPEGGAEVTVVDPVTGETSTAPASSTPAAATSSSGFPPYTPVYAAPATTWEQTQLTGSPMGRPLEAPEVVDTKPSTYGGIYSAPSSRYN